VLAFGTRVRGFKPKPSDFSGKKILSAPSFGGEVKPSVPCRALRHVKDPKSDVEVVTFGKILGNFSPIVPPSVAGFASVASALEASCSESWNALNPWLSSKLWFDVPLATALCKTFLLRMLNDS
jgi:hypothetical protein